MFETNRADTEIFDGGPPFRLEKSLGLIKSNQRRSVQRALLAVLIVWAPLLVLSAIESLVLEENKAGLVDCRFDRYLPLFDRRTTFHFGRGKYDFSAWTDSPPF
jgi:hypothetical protein